MSPRHRPEEARTRSQGRRSLWIMRSESRASGTRIWTPTSPRSRLRSPSVRSPSLTGVPSPEATCFSRRSRFPRPRAEPANSNPSRVISAIEASSLSTSPRADPEPQALRSGWRVKRCGCSCNELPKRPIRHPGGPSGLDPGEAWISGSDEVVNPVGTALRFGRGGDDRRTSAQTRSSESVWPARVA